MADEESPYQRHYGDRRFEKVRLESPVSTRLRILNDLKVVREEAVENDAAVAVLDFAAFVIGHGGAELVEEAARAIQQMRARGLLGAE